jgi:hypothetical protein
MKRQKPPRTEAELEALWRKDPGFIGPVAPPMWLWLKDEEKQERWEIEMNLRGTFSQPSQLDMFLEPLTR